MLFYTNIGCARIVLHCLPDCISVQHVSIDAVTVFGMFCSSLLGFKAR